MSRTTIDHFSAERFKKLRAESGLSLAALARQAGITRSSIYQWEEGGTTPTVETLSIVMDVLHTPMSEVLDIKAGEATLKDVRILSGHTRAEVREALGMSPSGWGAIERGDTLLSEDRIEPLAQLFGVNPTVVIQAARNTFEMTPPPLPRRTKEAEPTDKQ